MSGVDATQLDADRFEMSRLPVFWDNDGRGRFNRQDRSRRLETSGKAGQRFHRDSCGILLAVGQHSKNDRLSFDLDACHHADWLPRIVAAPAFVEYQAHRSGLELVKVDHGGHPSHRWNDRRRYTPPK